MSKFQELNCEKELEAESMLNGILPPPYDPPPYTSKEHLAQDPEEFSNENDSMENRDILSAKQQNLQNIIASSSSDISNTSVDIPGIIKSSPGESTGDKNDSSSQNEDSSQDSHEQNDEAVRIDTLHSS